MATDLQEHADRYERLDIIGRGSFGDVYRGQVVLSSAVSYVEQCQDNTVTLCSWDRVLQREVAIKVIDLEDV